MKQTFWKNVVSVLTGSVMAQAIPVLGALVIARVYSPAEFGLYASWLGGVLIFSVILTARFETALAIVEEGHSRVIAVFSVLIVIALLAITIGVVAGALIVNFQTPWLESFPDRLVWMFLPASALLAVTQVWQSWASAEGEFRKLTIMRLVQASTVTVIQIVAGYFVSTASSLGFAFFTGLVIGLAVSYKLMPLAVPGGKVFLKDVALFCKRYKNYPVYSLPADTVNSATLQLPVIILSVRFGAEIAGYLALTLKVLGFPLSLMGNAVLDVFKHYAASAYKEYGECRSYYLMTLKALLSGAIPFGMVIFFLGEDLFVMAFGQQWREAGVLSLWLLPMFMMRFIASPLSYMVYIAEKQWMDLFWQMILLVMTVISLYSVESYQYALQLYCAGYCLLYLVYLSMSYKFSLGVRV